MAAALKKLPKSPFPSLSKPTSKPPQPSKNPAYKKTPQSPTPASTSLSDPINRIKSNIRSESDPERLAALFLANCTVPQFHGDRPLYKFSIQKLSRANRPDLVERILETQRSDPTLPRSEGFLIRIITLYSEAGLVEQAVKTFDSIPEVGIKHTERSFCALLGVFLKNRKFDRLVETFSTMPETIKITPGITAHNIVMQGFCEMGDAESARKMLDEMPLKKIKPDIVTYNTMFNGYLKKGDKDGCDEILKEMSAKGLEGDVVTYNCRIAGLCKNGKSFEAEELLDLMGAKKVRANRQTYNTIIEGFCKEGNSKRAMKVFERMKSAGKGKGSEEGVSPNFDTYVVLFKSLIENREYDKGLEVFKECVGRKWALPFYSVRGLVEGLKNDQKVDEAKDVVAKIGKVVKGDAVDAWKKVEAMITF